MTRRRLLAAVFALATCGLAEARAVAAAPAIVVLHDEDSNARSPYAVASEAVLKSSKGAASFAVTDGNHDVLLTKITANHPDAIVAIGPASMRVAETSFPAVPCVVVLASPDPTLTRTSPTYRFEVPPDVQMSRIARVMSDVSRVGVLFDPANSQKLVNELTAAGKKVHLTVVPIPVSSEADVRTAMSAKIGSIDALLFVNDRTIGRNTIKDVLRRLRSTSTPAIGFNFWCVDNGAVLAIEPAPAALGAQAARAVSALLAAKTDIEAPPDGIVVWIDPGMAGSLSVRADYDRDDPEVREIPR